NGDQQITACNAVSTPGSALKKTLATTHHRQCVNTDRCKNCKSRISRNQYVFPPAAMSLENDTFDNKSQSERCKKERMLPGQTPDSDREKNRWCECKKDIFSQDRPDR